MRSLSVTIRCDVCNETIVTIIGLCYYFFVGMNAKIMYLSGSPLNHINEFQNPYEKEIRRHYAEKIARNQWSNQVSCR